MADVLPAKAGRRRRRAAAYGCVLGVLWGLPAAIALVAWGVEPLYASEPCIGFLCTSNPAQAALLLTALASFILAPAGLAAVVMLALAQWCSHPFAARPAWSQAALVLCWLAAGGLIWCVGAVALAFL